MASVSYTPDPNEQPYFDALFQAADTGRKGSLGGAEAVGFFSRSKLPVDVLKNVWTLADQNPTNNSLDVRKFYTAVRLIQLSQNGVQGQGATLVAPPGTTLKPVMFEGVSGVTIPLPQPATAPQQQQAAPTPPRPPQPRPPAPTAMSTALTAQDPYSLPPNEQSRYEQLFPQFAKEGYVYGNEAVELFKKSGLPQDQLGAIWNMVDNPIDNRLDPLEFAMAMHLIVCISKKNLPMPPSLPVSLKMLKSQQQAQQGASPSLRPVPQQPPSPQVSAMSAPPNLPPTIAQTATSDASVMSTLSGPPPLAPSGGVSISDAFEGLSTGGGGMTGMGTMSDGGMTGMGTMSGGLMESTPMQDAALPPPEQPSNASAVFAAAAVTAAASIGADTLSVSSIPEPSVVAAPAPAMQMAAQVAAAPAPTIMSTKQLAASYDQGDEHEELAKLKETLQKLQAENISLKASMGHMSAEEKEVQKEISATVAEIGRLSSELTTLRAQVLAAKSALLEATAELKGHKDKQAELNDLIGDTRATKEALDTALGGVHEFTDEVEHREHVAPTMDTHVNEADLFGFDAAPMAAAAPPMIQSVTSEDSDAVEEVPTPQQQYAPEPTHQPDTSYSPYDGIPAPVAIPAPAAMQERVPSYATDGLMGGVTSPSSVPFSEPAGANSDPLQDAVIPSSPSAAEVEQLKGKALQAEETAREAENTSRTLAAQVDDLRKIADQAEAEARAKTSHASEKKGRFGRGKKKDAKEAEKAKQEAAQKRKDFMDMQGQANTAQTLAMQTRQESERLREVAEKAEMDAVAAQSRQSHAAEVQHQMVSVAPNGGGSYGIPVPQEKSNGAMAQMDTGYGNGGQPMGFGGGFNSNVMGGAAADGGMGIPSPADLGDQAAYPW